jgi:hypothetical protein
MYMCFRAQNYLPSISLDSSRSWSWLLSSLDPLWSYCVSLNNRLAYKNQTLLHVQMSSHETAGPEPIGAVSNRYHPVENGCSAVWPYWTHDSLCRSSGVSTPVPRFSPQSSGFALRVVHVGFVVDKVTLGQVFLRILRLSPVNIHIHSCIIWRVDNGPVSGRSSTETFFDPIIPIKNNTAVKCQMSGKESAKNTKKFTRCLTLLKEKNYDVITFRQVGLKMSVWPLSPPPLRFGPWATACLHIALAFPD